jgi:hypothetical protein
MAYGDDLDPDTTNRLLSGRLEPDDAPPRHRDVAVLLRAAHIEAGASAVADDALVAAIVDAILTTDLARPRRKHVLTRIVMTKTAAVAVVALSATGAAAATGNLPDAAQAGLARAAQHIGINLPSPANDKAREQTQRDDPNDEDATDSSLPAAFPATATGDKPAVGADEDRADASTRHGPPAGTPGVDETTPAADATHGSVVSEVAKNADSEGGKGDEVAPVARDNHGVEARAEHQPEHPVPDSPPEPGGNAHSNKP